MTELAPNVVWENGFTLREALSEYSDQKNRAAYKELAALVIPDLPPLGLVVLAPSDNLTPLTYDPAQIWGRFQRAEADAKADVLRHLQAGELVAVGYAFPRGRRDAPVPISPSAWADAQVSWDEAAISSGSGIFEEVRVIESPEHARAAIIKAVLDPPVKKRGQPSRREEIVAAYIVLRNAGRINFNFLNPNIQLIQDAVLAANPRKAKKALGKTATENAIKELFRADQTAHRLGKNPGNSAGKPPGAK